MKDSRETPIKASEIESRKIFRVGYQMGEGGKGSNAFAFTDPDSNGVCKAFLLPGGAESVHWLPEFRDDTEPNKKTRRRTQGERISRITSPESNGADGGAKTTQSLKSEGGQLAHAEIEHDFCLRDKLSRLQARLMFDSEDPTTTQDLIDTLETLKVGHPETLQNVYLTKLVYAENVLTEDEAEGALKEAKVCLQDAKYIGLEVDSTQKLWPALFQLDTNSVFDSDLFMQLSLALVKRRASLVVSYDRLELLLGLLHIADPTGEKKRASMRNHPDNWLPDDRKSEHDEREKIWCEHVETTYRYAQSIGVADHRTTATLTENAALRAAISGVKSAKSLAETAQKVVENQASKTLGNVMGNMVPLHDAIKRLPNAHNHSVQVLLTASIYRGIAQTYGQTFCGPLLKHLDELAAFLAGIKVIDEEEDDETEDSDIDMGDGSADTS